MTHLITPHCQRRSFFRPRRTWDIWGAVRRSQILEVAALTGAIVLVWLRARLDNQPGFWAEALSAKMESAQVQPTDRVHGG
jgi:hypothetical protein